MNKAKSHILILLFTTLISCSQEIKEIHNVIINSEKCSKWNLPELNVNLKIPKNYKLTYNEIGGFYLQARKFDKEGNLIAEISIGRIEGELKDSDIIKTLNIADEELINQLKNIEQINYKTTFIGEELINGEKLKILKGIIEFSEYEKNMNGKFYTFMSPIILNEKNKFMLSSMFRENENFNSNKISFELLEIMNSIKIEK